VLATRGARITEVTAFGCPELLPAFGLPATTR
jgi:hypothetical protein